MTEVFQTGETVRLTSLIVNEDGDAVDPTTVVINIAKPGGTLAVTAAAMTKTVPGTYYYDYTIGTDVGKYSVEVLATGASARVTKQPSTFRVEASL